MRDYQREAVPWLRERPYSFLFIDMGLGKTAVVLTLLADLADTFSFRRALVCAPLKVANEVWPQELAVWRHTAHLSHRLLTGTREERERAAAEPALLHITNHESLPWLVEAWGKAWPYDVLIYDESTRIGNHANIGFRALKAVRLRLRRIHLLTATPAAQSLEKLFAPTWLLDQGARLGQFVTHFRRHYMVEDPYSHKWDARPGAVEQVTKRIADIALTMKREDHLSMRDPIRVPRLVHLDPAEMEAYQRFEKEFVLELPDGEELEAPTAAVLAGKLLQLSSGAVYDAERAAHRIHDHKLEELRRLEEEAVGQPLLVAYWFQSSRQRILEAFPHAVALDRAGSQVAAWNRRELPMLLVHPQSAAHGLNLQFGGHHLAVFDLFHSLELFLQLVKRLDRPGQRETVIVHLLTALGTLDEVVVQRLRRLEAAQDGLFAHLKALQQKIKAGKGTP